MNFSNPLDIFKKWNNNKLDVQNARIFSNQNTKQQVDSLIKTSPWNASQPIDMRSYSPYFNVPNDCADNPGPGLHKFLSDIEKSQHDPEYPEFYYNINDLGFRDYYPCTTESNIIGFFGCSFTWGEGLDTTTNFPHLVSSHFHCPHLNFGVGGTGAQRIALTFAAAANIWPMEIAVITLPNWARFHYVDSIGNLKRIHLPFKISRSDELEIVRQSLISSFSDQYMLSMTKDAINYMLTVAKLKNIKLVLASWDFDTRAIIKGITEKSAVEYELWNNNYAEFKRLKTPGMFARDMSHPGTILAKNYADTLIKHIENLH